MKIGDKLKGKITGIQPYGAFVELESGLIGLIHISEIRTGYIDNIHDILKIGDQVLVQVVDYDDLVAAGSEAKAREAGKIRTEGKAYVMQPGDVVEFRFNVSK